MQIDAPVHRGCGSLCIRVSLVQPAECRKHDSYRYGTAMPINDARHLDRFDRLRARMAFTDHAILAVLQTEAIDMSRFLAWLSAEYGGPEAFLSRHGLASAQIETLRSRLLA
jgi:hypothetical protein